MCPAPFTSSQPQSCPPGLHPGSSRLWWSCPVRRSRASRRPPTSHMSPTACGLWGFCHTCPSACPRCGCCRPWRHLPGSGTLGFWAKERSNQFAQCTELLHQALLPPAPEDSRTQKSTKDNFLFWLKIREAGQGLSADLWRTRSHRAREKQIDASLQNRLQGCTLTASIQGKPGTWDLGNDLVFTGGSFNPLANEGTTNWYLPQALAGDSPGQGDRSALRRQHTPAAMGTCQMLPRLCRALPPAGNMPACGQSATVLAGLKAATSVHMAQGGQISHIWKQLATTQQGQGSHSPLSFAQHLYHSTQF